MWLDAPLMQTITDATICSQKMLHIWRGGQSTGGNFALANEGIKVV